MKLSATFLLASTGLFIVSPSCLRQQSPDDPRALATFRTQVEKALPAVASLSGSEKPESIRVGLFTRTELGAYFRKYLTVEYPDGELTKRGRSFALIGLLPRGYDLEQGFVSVLSAQAGAVYDPRSKTLIGLRDLVTERDRAVDDRMILAHELTHALQDRMIDIARVSEAARENVDYEYALRAVLEGMASSVMLAYAQDRPLGALPPLKDFWRSQLSRAPGGSLGGSPPYLTEYLISPYAEGGAFVQNWHEKHPGAPLCDLLKSIPASSEQVLHYEKYSSGDLPATIDLSPARRVVPRTWNREYANVLGELDLAVLFQIHTATGDNADALAAGWDGCRFETYAGEDGETVLFGTSVWDSENDAEEFAGGFSDVLDECRPERDYGIVQVEQRTHFVVGASDGGLRKDILEALAVRR